MPLVTWDKSYSVSVQKFDQQHQKLFDLLNKLYEAMKKGHGQEIVQYTVRELSTYTLTHFRAEEEVLRKTNYPGLAAHQAEHQKFVAQVSQFAEQLKAGKVTSSITVLTFLKDWLAKHIQQTDRSYAAYLNSQGVK